MTGREVLFQYTWRAAALPQGGDLAAPEKKMQAKCVITRLLSTIVCEGDSLAAALWPDRQAAADRCICLYYHEVTARQEARFRRQLDMLARSATLCGLRDIGPACRRLRVALTFDDAYADTLARVTPLLAERDIPFAVFVPTGHLGRNPGWLADPAERSRVGPVADAEALRRLPELVTVGSHTVSHPVLPDLDASALRRELEDSRLDLERILQRSVHWISFPYGRYGQRELDACRAAGYLRCFTIAPGYTRCGGVEYVTRRVKCSPDDPPWAFRLKFSGADRWLPSWRRKLTGSQE